MDKSWNGDPSATVRIRTNDTPAERAAARATRAAERAGAAAQRLDARAAVRAEAVAARGAARVARREQRQQAAAVDPHAAAARQPRASGRRDLVREQRDTRHYTTIVDVRRMRELARRGASAAMLATAFGIPEQQVVDALAAPEETGAPA